MVVSVVSIVVSITYFLQGLGRNEKQCIYSLYTNGRESVFRGHITQISNNAFTNSSKNLVGTKICMKSTKSAR